MRRGLQSEGNRKQLSSWLQPLVSVHDGFGSCAGSLTAFFAACAQLAQPSRPAKPAPQVQASAWEPDTPGVQILLKRKACMACIRRA